MRGVRRVQSSSATARSRDAGVVTVPHVELGMTRLSMDDFGDRSWDDIVRVGAIVARDYVQEVNSRGRPSIMGIEFPPTDAAGMMADGTAQFFDNVATVHDRQASGLSRRWAGVQVGMAAWSGVATLRTMSAIPKAGQAVLNVTQGAEAGAATTRAAVVGERGAFAGHRQLFEHFTKHADECRHASPAEYMAEAQRIMREGIPVDYLYNGTVRRGFVQFMEQGRKSAKFAFVGTNRAGHITTLHVKRAPDLWKMLNGNSKVNVITPAL